MTEHLATLPDSNLQVTITPTGAEAVGTASAQTAIVNSQVEPGTQAVPEFVLVSSYYPSMLTHDGNAYTLTVDNLPIAQTVSLAIANAADVTGNDLIGTLKASIPAGSTVTGTGSLLFIAPGGSYQGLQVTLPPDNGDYYMGSYTGLVTFSDLQSNASGYFGTLSPLTLTTTGRVVEIFASVAFTPL